MTTRNRCVTEFIPRLRSWRMGIRLMLVIVAATGMALAGDVTPARPLRATPKTTPSSSTKTSSLAKKKTTGKKTVAHRHSEPVQMAPTPARISEIQAALAASGSYRADPTGKMDAGTIEALTQFQSSHGLTPTGKINAPTLEKLGLGSATAGRGAPMPVPSALKVTDTAPQTP